MSSDLFIKFSKSPHEWLNDLEDLYIEGICKEKQDKISHLVEMLKMKQEKLNRLKSNISMNKYSIEHDLAEKYRLETGDLGYSTAANTLFGMSEIDVDTGPTVDLNDKLKSSMSSNKDSIEHDHVEKYGFVTGNQGYSTAANDILLLSEIDGRPSVKLNNKSYPSGKISMNMSKAGCWQLSGNLTSVNFPSRQILIKLKIVKLLISLHKEKCTTIEYMNKYKELTEKMCDLLLLKQKTIFKVVEAYQRAFTSLNIEAQLLKYTILKYYYSEDEGVVKASQKLKEIILTEVEALECKETELTEKIKAFKKLEGTQFDRLLRDYLALRHSINDKKWTLENMK